MPESDRDWQRASLAELAHYIVLKHHTYVRQEIQRLGPLFPKVIDVHGNNHAELAKIEQSFHALSQELTLHLMKEEHMLFPYIEQLEIAANRGVRPVPPMFGTCRIRCA